MKAKKLMFVLFMMCPIICFGRTPLLILSAEQAKAIIVAHQALKDEPEKDQFDIMLQEESDSFMVSFGKGMIKNSSMLGGGNKVVSCKVSKEDYKIASIKRYFSR